MNIFQNFLADNMAVRELLSVANFFHSALEQARKGEDTNESSVFYGLNSQVYCKLNLFKAFQNDIYS